MSGRGHAREEGQQIVSARVDSAAAGTWIVRGRGWDAMIRSRPAQVRGPVPLPPLPLDRRTATLRARRALRGRDSAGDAAPRAGRGVPAEVAAPVAGRAEIRLRGAPKRRAGRARGRSRRRQGCHAAETCRWIVRARRSLGFGLSDDEISRRAAGVDAWLSGFSAAVRAAAAAAPERRDLATAVAARAGMETGRGDAAAATWIFRGDGSRRRRGRDADIPWRRESRRRRGWDADIPRRRVATTPRPRRGYSEGESWRRRG